MHSLNALLTFIAISLFLSSCTKQTEQLNRVDEPIIETFSSLKYVSSAQLSVARSRPNAAAIASKIYFGPGLDGWNKQMDIIDVYDTATKVWSTVKLPHTRNSPFVTSYGSKLFLYGGWVPNKYYYDMEVYDTLSKKWDNVTLMHPHNSGAIIASGKNIYFAGGQNYFGEVNDKVEVFDMQSMTLQPEMKLSKRRAVSKVYEVKDKLFFMGGFDNWTSGPSFTTVDIYSKTNGKWDSTNLIRPNKESSFSYDPNAVWGNKIGFTTYSYNLGTLPDSTYFYDTQDKTWSALKNPAAIFLPQILIAGNLMIMAGGKTKIYSDTPFDEVSVFDLVKKTWSSIKLSRPRTDVEIFRMGTKVFIAGGSNNFNSSNAVDIFELMP